MWIRLHGLREADSPKFDYAGTDRAKALRKWRYQRKDLTYTILKLSARPVERSLHSAALRSSCLEVLDWHRGHGLPGLLGGDAAPALALFCTLEVQSVLSNTASTHLSFQQLRHWKHSKCWITSASPVLNKKMFWLHGCWRNTVWFQVGTEI